MQLDSDGDGQLSFEEFKVLFANADKRKKSTQNQETPVLHQTTKVLKTDKYMKDTNTQKIIIQAGQTRPPDQSSSKPPKRRNSKLSENCLPANLSRLSLRGQNSNSVHVEGQKCEKSPAKSKIRNLSIA